MKLVTSTYTKTLSTALLLLAAALFPVSCEKIALDASEVNESEASSTSTTASGERHKVTVIARSSAAQGISYPIEVYAYNEEGDECAHQTVSSASEGISMTLTEGQYSLSATSGFSSYDTTKGYSSSPLMAGSTTVTVGSSALTANIILSYVVAAVDISLTDVPASVTAASVTIASQYTGVSNRNVFSGSAAVTIPCSKTGVSQSKGGSRAGDTGETWQTGTVYLLPGCGSSTELTVALTSSAGTTSYGVTYPEALKAATPYHFSGSYSGEASAVQLTGTLSSSDWQSEVNGSFSFGPTGGSFSGGGSSETVTVGSIPAQGALWDGHLVAVVGDESGGAADALLLSITEWSSLTSALYEADPTVAQRLADGYVEGSLGGWCIPTSDEVRWMKEVWSSDNIATLNSVLDGVSGSSALAVTDDDGKNVRYLCEKAAYTYSWANGGSILSAGKTVKTYRLRLVKRVRFMVRS